MKVHRKRSSSVAAFVYHLRMPSQELNQTARNIGRTVLKYVLSIVPIKAHVKCIQVSRMAWCWLWEGGAGVDCRGLKHLLHITITYFDQCLH